MTLDFDPAVDYYKALGVDAKAASVDIKKAYRKLAKQYHPDTTGGDKTKESRFKEASAAYDVLGDAKKRAQYDQVRTMGGRRGRVAGPGPGGTGGTGQVWDMGDLFAQMFQSSAPRAGTDPRRRAVRFDQMGAADDDWVFESRTGSPRAPAAEDRTESKVQASDGSWLIVRGGDVYSDVHVAFHEAMLGTIAEVATIDGVASVKIPPGTSSGRRLRLRGKGAAVRQGSGFPGPVGPGDHYVTVQLDVPAQLDDKAKKLLHDLTQHLSRDTKGRPR